MSELIDYYEILQVSPNAGPEVIEAAYKRLAKMNHPDVGGDTQTMILLNQAYAVLGNPKEREAYDKVYFAQMDTATSDYMESDAQAAIFAEMIKPRPWTRFLARYIDFLLWMMVFVFVICPFIPYSLWVSIGADSRIVFGMITLIFFLPVEAALLSAFGFTPGKLLLRIRVTTLDGDTLPYINALRRSVGALGWGFGFGLPFVSPICMWLSYNALKTWGITKWDASSRSVVLHGPLGMIRIIVSVIITFGLMYFVYS